MSLSRRAMERLGLEGGETMLLDITDDGAIVLRLAGAYPLEVYSDQRVEEFLEENEVSGMEREAVSRLLLGGDPEG